MENYREIFCRILNVEDSELENLKYHDVVGWDSVGHMDLIAELEDCFDIMFETEDILDFSSFEKGIEILKKYDVELA